MLHKMGMENLNIEDEVMNSDPPNYPTYTGYYPEEKNGRKIICREEWWIGGFENEASGRIRHRCNGPAYTTYDMEGNVVEAFWYINGLYIDNALIEKMFGKGVPIPLTKAQQVELKLKYG